MTSDVQEVPVVFSVLTMVSYIFVGAWIFYSWENWSVIKGTYFCFITLSTIGYGDIVPDVYRGSFSLPLFTFIPIIQARLCNYGPYFA